MDADDEADTDRRAWARRVAAELQKLPARQASAVRLIYNHELTYAEAAGWLGVATREVEALVADALHAWRRACSGIDDTGADRARRTSSGARSPVASVFRSRANRVGSVQRRGGVAVTAGLGNAARGERR